MQSYDQQVKKVTCVNSWGMVEPNPKLDLKDVEFLYRVDCSTVDATQQSKFLNLPFLANFYKLTGMSQTTTMIFDKLTNLQLIFCYSLQLIFCLCCRLIFGSDRSSRNANVRLSVR